MSIEDKDEQESESAPKGRGRPSTGEAKSGAERQKELRERRKEQGLVQLTVFIPKEMMVALNNFILYKDVDKDTVVQNCIRRELMRKR